MTTQGDSSAGRDSALKVSGKKIFTEPLGGTPVQQPKGKAPKLGSDSDFECTGASGPHPVLSGGSGPAGVVSAAGVGSGLAGGPGSLPGSVGPGSGAGVGGTVDENFPGTIPPSSNQIDSQFDMGTRFREIRGINCNISDMRGQIDNQFTHLRNDMNLLKDELTQLKTVSTIRFEELEDRINKLEQNVASPTNPDVKYLQVELDRLDPALRSISLLGFKGQDTKKRDDLINELLKENCPHVF